MTSVFQFEEDLFQSLNQEPFEQHGCQILVDRVLCIIQISSSTEERHRMMLSVHTYMTKPLQAGNFRYFKVQQHSIILVWNFQEFFNRILRFVKTNNAMTFPVQY